ncbi:hypothetical protein NUW54_g3876 [Trametes sanguinea]|uniref:Uncharacterized protein n=1 Tax=Trametes sanguinea TaxID=158606 RepID=A0ACC1Q036_9APHY|nr:hypothetical protein NUW54_g3876 [Trametes sanguinea]
MRAMHPDLLYSSNSEQPLLATGSPDPTDDGFDAALPPSTQGENDSGSDDSSPLLSDLLIKDSSDLEDGVQAGHNARSARPLPIFPSIHSSELEGSSNGAACLSPGVDFGPSQGTLYHSHSDEATSMPAPANQRDTPFLSGSENGWLFDMGRSPSVTEQDASQATSPRNSSPYTAATSRLVHPAVNGKPCDSSGHTLPENAPARPPPTRDASDWTPYADHVAFELADLLYRREQMPASNVKSLLQLWAVGLVEHGGRPPFASVANMYNAINCTLLGDARWQSFELQYSGDLPDSSVTPSWMNASYSVFYQDPLAILHNMLGNPDFKDNIDYAPYREVDHNSARRLENFMLGEWAWRQANVIARDLNAAQGASFIPVILGSDKTTVSVATGQNEYYPLYCSIGNVHNNVRRVHRNTLAVLGILAIPKIIKGTFKDHLVTWIEQYLTQTYGEAISKEYLAEIDRCIAVYLPTVDGLIPHGMVRSIRFFLEFCYLVHHDVQSEASIAQIREALASFRVERESFYHIWEYGSPNSLCSSITESQHIKAIKEPWRHSNRYKALGQMLTTNQRLDKLAAARVDYADRGMLEGNCLKAMQLMLDPEHQSPPPLENQPQKPKKSARPPLADEDGAVPGPRVMASVMMAATAKTRHASTADGLAAEFAVPSFSELIRRFLLPPFPSNSLHISATAIFYACSDPSGLGGMCREIIRAAPEWRKRSSRFDCIFVNRSNDLPGLLEMDVTRVRLFFAFRYQSRRYECALVHWFKRIADVVDEDTEEDGAAVLFDKLPVALSVLLNERGGIINNTIITKHAEDAFCAITDPGRRECNLAWFKERLDEWNTGELACLKGHSSTRSQMIGGACAAGPGGHAVYARLGTLDLRWLTFGDCAFVPIEGFNLHIVHGSYTGEDGSEVCSDAVSPPLHRVRSDTCRCITDLHPAVTGVDVTQLLSKPPMQPTGLGAHDSLRLEVGICLYSQDLEENMPPIEDVLTWVIGKNRCNYGTSIGTEGVRKHLKEGPPWRQVGMIVKSAPARSHDLCGMSVLQNAMGAVRRFEATHVYRTQPARNIAVKPSYRILPCCSIACRSATANVASHDSDRRGHKRLYARSRSALAG